MWLGRKCTGCSVRQELWFVDCVIERAVVGRRPVRGCWRGCCHNSTKLEQPPHHGLLHPARGTNLITFRREVGRSGWFLTVGGGGVRGLTSIHADYIHTQVQTYNFYLTLLVPTCLIPKWIYLRGDVPECSDVMEGVSKAVCITCMRGTRSWSYSRES